MKRAVLFVMLVACGFATGGAARHYIWDHYRRCEVLPWLIPKPERLAKSMFLESICQTDPLIKGDHRTVLAQAGYSITGEEDPQGADFDFRPPLSLSVPEYRIENWQVFQYSYGEGSGVEIGKPLPVVAQSLGLEPANGKKQTLLWAGAVFPKIPFGGVRLESTARGTMVKCWYLDI